MTTHLLPKDPNRSGDFLFVDLYHGELGGRPDWVKIRDAATPPGYEYIGGIIKATQGTSYDTTWFHTNYAAIASAAPARLGIDWFRGAYHYLVVLKDANLDHVRADAIAQAEFYVATVVKAGGWSGAVLPAVDLESASNAGVTRAQVEAATSAFAQRVKELTGRLVILYTRTLVKDLGITSHMGCDVLWAIDLSATLNNPPAPGWTLAQTGLWQYGEDGKGNLAGAPLSVPGVGPTDVNIYIDGANKTTLMLLRARIVDPTVPGWLPDDKGGTPTSRHAAVAAMIAAKS